MHKFWSLREEIYRSLHRWPTILIFLVVGCLAGLGSSYVWPTFYKSTVQVYVGLNPYRTFSDANFLALKKPRYSNIDDYKNWQMLQLESVILLDAFMQDTLGQLRQADPSWEDIDVETLRMMLRSDWRSAGTWSLSAQHRDPEVAQQAIETWRRVVLERVEKAILASQQTFQVDQELQSIADQKTAVSVRQQALTLGKEALQQWSQASNENPASQPLALDDRWEILALVTPLADFTPAWAAILDEQPSADAPAEAYRLWIARIIPLIDSELAGFEQRLEALEEQKTSLAVQYAQVADESLSLSPNLKMEGFDQPTTRPVRSAGTLTILGAVIGLLAWVFTQLVLITNRKANP